MTPPPFSQEIEGIAPEHIPLSAFIPNWWKFLQSENIKFYIMMVFLSTMEWTLIDCSISRFHRRRFVFHVFIPYHGSDDKQKTWPVIINPNMLQNLRSLTHDHRSFTSKFFDSAGASETKNSDLMVVLYILISVHVISLRTFYFF